MDGFSERIAKTIVRSLEKGLILEQETIFFLESTYGIDAGALESILADGDFDEIDTVCSLIFPPPFATRVAVEALLAGGEADIVDQARVLEHLLVLLPSVEMVMPDSSRFTCGLTRENGQILVGKLYLQRAHDPEVMQSLLEFFEVDKIIEVLVFIRCKDLALTVEMKRFLKVFLAGTAHLNQVTEALICRFLKILSETPEGMSADKYFFKQKRQLKQKLLEIRIFQEKMEQYGMEYLLMQKYRVPHESEEAVLEQIARIEFMLEGVLGLKDPDEIYLGRKDLGSFDTGNDMEKLFRSLD